MGLFGSCIQRNNKGPKTSLFGGPFGLPPPPRSVGLLDEAGAQF